ncbi:unnamed protein product [Strongylus vulgaris]|uniref:NTR domain-containing protein n=1 Tax=Strongylus vulgaris TaxID=40348 RepID=A0A3P7JR34_STRVU|nr:unnamed protein product [Strongylus vulgaris]
MFDVNYRVRHIRTYKPSYSPPLPSLVYTPSAGATCGVNMEIGEQYLLSGSRQTDGSLHTYLCGQISDEGFGGLAPWRTISPALRANLTKFECKK